MTGTLGRPRSEQARRAILDTAVRLTMRDGYQAVTIKGIAEEAGVGRQTVYRWWTTKAALVLEAVGELAERAGRPAPTGDAEHDLRALLCASFRLAPKWPLGGVSSCSRCPHEGAATGACGPVWISVFGVQSYASSV